jgi:hypothetical protein
LKQRLGAIVRWALAVGILWWSGSHLADAWAGVDASLVTLKPGPALAGAVTGAIALLVLAVVSGVGVLAARLPSATGRVFWAGWMRVWFQGYFYRYIPGKVMLVVERARLGEHLGVPRAASVMLVVWESLLLLAGAGIFGGGGLVALPGMDTGPLSGGLVVGLAVVSALGSVLMWPILAAIARRAPALAARLPGLVLDVPALTQMALVLGNAVAWGLLGASFAFVCAAMTPGEIPPAGPLIVWFVASYVGGQLTGVVPAGIGVREGLLVAGLASFAPAPLVLAWAVGHRILLAIVELVLLGASLLVRLPELPSARHAG